MSERMVNKMLNKKEFVEWIVDTTIKVVKTMSQTAVGIIGVSVVMSDVDWMMVGSSAILSGIVCALMSISSLPKTDEYDSE